MRNLSLDYMKVVLSFLVVLLHLNFLRVEIPVLGFVFVNGVFRLAVPLFLIITGYYFSQIKTVASFKVWLRRVFIIYLLWMVFYAPFWIKTNDVPGSILTIFTGYFVLWYFPAVILGGVLLFLSRKMSTLNLALISVCLYLAGYVLQQLGNLHAFDGAVDKALNWYPLTRNFLFDSYPLLALGYLIQRSEVGERCLPFWIVLFLLVMIVLESYLNYSYVSKEETLDHLLFIPLAASAVFIYVKEKVVLGRAKTLAFYSTAVFLIHPFFMSVHGYFSLDISRVMFVLVSTALASVGLVLVNKRVRFIL